MIAGSVAESNRDDHDAVEVAVAAILRALVEGMPRELAEVVRVRSATRRVIEANLPLADEVQLLMGVYAAAKSARLLAWCARAILEETHGPEVPSLPPVSEQHAGEWLRRGGFDKCPICLHAVPHQLELEQTARRRVAAEEAEERWRGAAPLAGLGA